MTGRQEYDRTKDRQRILGKYMIDGQRLKLCRRKQVGTMSEICEAVLCVFVKKSKLFSKKNTTFLEKIKGKLISDYF